MTNSSNLNQLSTFARPTTNTAIESLFGITQKLHTTDKIIFPTAQHYSPSQFKPPNSNTLPPTNTSHQQSTRACTHPSASTNGEATAQQWHGQSGCYTPTLHFQPRRPSPACQYFPRNHEHYDSLQDHQGKGTYSLHHTDHHTALFGMVLIPQDERQPPHQGDQPARRAL